MISRRQQRDKTLMTIQLDRAVYTCSLRRYVKAKDGAGLKIGAQESHYLTSFLSPSPSFIIHHFPRSPSSAAAIAVEKESRRTVPRPLHSIDFPLKVG